MKAAILRVPKVIDVVDVPRPEPGEGEVLLKVAFCGICGSDLHPFLGHTQLADPMFLGHEFSGVVESLGQGVDWLRVGDRVCVEPIVPCGHCRFCHLGNTQLCERRAGFGGGSGPGGFAEYVSAPADILLRLPEDVSLEEGAMVEPVAVTVHAMSLARMEPGATVCILGAGPIGLLMMQTARASGAGRVFVTAKRPQQIQAARQLGATAVIPAGGDVIGAVQQLTDGTGVDVCITTVGGTEPVGQQAISLVGKRGRVVLLGVFTARQEIDLEVLVEREIEVVGSNCYGYNRIGRRDFELALALVASRRVDVASLITHHYSLERIADGFRTAVEKPGNYLKALVAC